MGLKEIVVDDVAQFAREVEECGLSVVGMRRRVSEVGIILQLRPVKTFGIGNPVHYSRRHALYYEICCTSCCVVVDVNHHRITERRNVYIEYLRTKLCIYHRPRYNQTTALPRREVILTLSTSVLIVHILLTVISLNEYHPTRDSTLEI